MKDDVEKQTGYFRSEDCEISEFTELVTRSTDLQSLTYAASVAKNVPIYDMAQCGEALDGERSRKALMSEWATILGTGAGVVVIKNAFEDLSVIDRATDLFTTIIESERVSGAGGGDHFAAVGANDRVWNALQKMCVASPELFAQYFSNISIAAISEAWLGPNYQMTAQVNNVRPGGKAQIAHRDYHLGFMSLEDAMSYPAHIHLLSPALTLQGAVAHTDMPIESGPTKLLPFSQSYAQGYVASQLEAFRDCFDKHHIQLELEKGDMLFFSPALIHGAGENRTKDKQRTANLLQVGSAFGRSIETVDTRVMSETLYPVLQTLVQDNGLSQMQLNGVIASCAEGYAYPTNLDNDPPVDGGLAPRTQQQLFKTALAEGWSKAAFSKALAEMAQRQKP